MTYAHCVIVACVPEADEDEIAQSLLRAVADHPGAGPGIYVIAVRSSVATCEDLAWSAVESVASKVFRPRARVVSKASGEGA